MTTTISFQEAIEDSEQFTKRHLILGNGFSISCRPDIFHYGSLFEQANFDGMPEARQVFDALNTQDFEVAIKALENAADIIPFYLNGHEQVVASMQAHSNNIKEVLISTVAGNHPALPMEIDELEFYHCRQFLYHFLGDHQYKGNVYTLNYDLLLYWALMHENIPFQEDIELETSDGFGNDENDPDADYVVWHGDGGAHGQKVFYLHGALHLYDAGSELKKFTWTRNGSPLIEQARNALENGLFPVFVSEGTSQQKKSKIRHNAYLYQGFKSLVNNTEQTRPCFFIFGHSLADNDDHILRHIGKGKFPKVYIGLHGDVDSEGNQQIIEKAHQLASQRKNWHPLDIDFFDSQSARVWR